MNCSPSAQSVSRHEKKDKTRVCPWAATYGPDTPDPVSITALKDGNIVAMANTMGGSGDAGDASTYNGNLGTTEFTIGFGRARCEEVGDQQLSDLVHKEERM